MFWQQAQQISQTALAAGSLLPISTQPYRLHENGIDFYLHIINQNLQAKISASKNQGNPFLPYDDDMFVSQAGDQHVCLLNKFPVLMPHLLICSNDFVEQSLPLTEADFAAWLLGFDTDQLLGFYNGGRTAGASQPHRHMQLVKAPIATNQLISQGNLPFEHRIFHYADPTTQPFNPATLTRDYIQGLRQLGLYDPQQCKPYNILLTRQWLLILPRSRNNIDGLFANGMNYAGHFLIRNEQQRQWLQDHGLMAFLKGCGVPR